MKGTFIELKYWHQAWADQAYAWKECGDYAAFWRTLPHEYPRESFVNLPQLMGCLIWGVFADGMIDTITGAPKLIGLVTAYDWDPNSRTSAAGLMIDKDAWKMGIGTDAFMTALRYLFECKNMRKVSLEFSSEEQVLVHLMNKMGALADARTKADGPIEENPFFEGRRKKHVIMNGKYFDFIMCACFKTQFDKMLENYVGKKRGKA